MENVVMDRFDFPPLFRSTIGFDRLTRLADAAMRGGDSSQSYPPYNIEKTGEDTYRVSMAVAGFSPDELDVTVQQNSLVVTGKAKKDGPQARYLHRGIAQRAFERHYRLADHIKVVGATVVNGMLHVDLACEVPEAAKPRKIEIDARQPEPVEQKQAA
jgi:molecular chaperone IbpA